MEIVNVQAIVRATRRHRDAGPWLERWVAAVLGATWGSLADVHKMYPSADGVALQRVVITVFNVKGNEYRLLTVMRYRAQQVYVIEVLTHAEYSKGKWKDRL
jgi:mRNA interferase HigB